MAVEEEMLNYEQASKLLGLRKSTLYAKVHRKEVPHFRLGRRLVVFKREELLAWLRARRVAGGGL